MKEDKDEWIVIDESQKEISFLEMFEEEIKTGKITVKFLIEDLTNPNKQ